MNKVSVHRGCVVYEGIAAIVKCLCTNNKKAFQQDGIRPLANRSCFIMNKFENIQSREERSLYIEK